MCSVILVFHKGRPILLRTVCTLVLPAVIGALVHLFSNTIVFEAGFAMIPALWRTGATLESGGIISGTFAELLMWLLGNVGTAITIILGIGILVFIVFKTTILRIVETYKNRQRLEYIPKPEYENQTTMPLQTHSSQSAVSRAPYPPPPPYAFENKKKYKHPLTPAWKKKKIDIPFDENSIPARDHFEDDDGEVPDYGYFKRQADNNKNDKRESTASEMNEPAYGEKEKGSDDSKADEMREGAANEDMPLDIPFMDGRIRRPPPLIPPILREELMPTDEYQTEPERDPRDIILPNLTEDSPAEPFNNSEPAPPDAFTSTKYRREAKPDSSKRTPTKPHTAPADFSPHDGASNSYAFPPLSLLSKGEPISGAGDGEVKLNTERLESAFRSFGVNVNISNATRGPSVTRYEAELEAGVKLSKLTNLADDIALSLGTIGVRIAAMPNRISTVGIEVPNKDISKVHLRDVLETKEFSGAASKLSFAIGMDITGDPIIGDISKLPHMLVAGTTGSGKSVCLNSIILSILYKSSPDDVRFIMVDPKMVEFKAYNDIPHLLVPVVTDAKKAAGALQWATFEMMKRYTLFAETNARDLAGYNQIARNSKDTDDERDPLPQVVVVIDELADLMMLAAKEVEESICRVAQMGRASGIHLIIATQSPRADVITGLMKANIPSRIAFKVSSSLESRIILDSGSSADKLVGYGDMLYAPTGAAKPLRLQGTWVTDSERESIIEYIKGNSGQTQYSEEVIGEIEKAMVEKSSGGDKSSAESGANGDFDELLPQAVDVILETGQASTSLLQRRLKLGYARAARIVDQMEDLGVVGPHEGSKPRQILVTREEWRQMQYVSGVAPED
jgi:S-DNA-T family DNA segregation ATPase FtsK/SpoIIIE